MRVDKIRLIQSTPPALQEAGSEILVIPPHLNALLLQLWLIQCSI